MNRGTHSGDLAEIDFVKRFNSEKNNQDFDFYINDLDIKELNDVYMVRVTTKQYSKLSNQTVMTRADTYLINSKDQLINELLFDNVINEIRDSGDKELNSSLNKILSNASVDKVECFRELDNLYSLGMIPGCVPEDVWNSSFHELLKTLGERDSLYENYYLLAVYTHEFMCDDDHYNNEYGSVECKTYKLK